MRGSGAKLVLALVVVGVLCGIWLLRPQPGKQSLARTLISGTKQEQVRPGTPSSEAPAAPAPGREVRRRNVISRLVSILFPRKAAAPPAPAPESQPQPVAEVQPPPAASPATSRAAPAPSRAASTPAAGKPVVPPVTPEAAAGTLYQAAVNLLNRNQVEKARSTLLEVTQKYPQTAAAGQAHDLLIQLPSAPPPRPAPADGGVTPSGAPPRAVAAASRPVEPSAPASSPAADPNRPSARKPVIPPSLLAAQAPIPASAAARDQVHVTGTVRQEKSLVVSIDCILDSMHARPVFLGAWLRDESGMQRVGYTATRVPPGNSSQKLTLMNVPEALTQLRVVLFEEHGALFLTRDFTLSK